MPTAVERFRGRSGTQRERKIVYLVEDTDDDSIAIQTALAAAPATWDSMGLVLKTNPASCIQIASTTWYVSVFYSESEDEARLNAESGDVEDSFSFSMSSEFVTQAIADVEQYPAAGYAKWDPNGVVNVATDGTIVGKQLAVPPTTHVIDYYPANATVTAGFRDTIEASVGSYNSATFRTRAAGTMLFVGCEGQPRTQTDWHIRYEFSFKANLSSYSVGGITVTTANGHDLLTYVYINADDTTLKRFAPKLRQVNVQQVYPTADLETDLAIPT